MHTESVTCSTLWDFISLFVLLLFLFERQASVLSVALRCLLGVCKSDLGESSCCQFDLFMRQGAVTLGGGWVCFLFKRQPGILAKLISIKWLYSRRRWCLCALIDPLRRRDYRRASHRLFSHKPFVCKDACSAVFRVRGAQAPAAGLTRHYLLLGCQEIVYGENESRFLSTSIADFPISTLAPVANLF